MFHDPRFCRRKNCHVNVSRASTRKAPMNFFYYIYLEMFRFTIPIPTVDRTLERSRLRQ